MNEDEGMKFWPMLLYTGIFNYLMFFPPKLCGKDLMTIKTPKHIVIINQVRHNHCCIINLQVVTSAS